MMQPHTPYIANSYNLVLTMTSSILSSFHVINSFRL